MLKNSARAEVKIDFSGNTYVRYFDRQGNPVGISKEKINYLGEKYIQHLDAAGEEISRTPYTDNWIEETTQNPMERLGKGVDGNVSKSLSLSKANFGNAGREVVGSKREYAQPVSGGRTVGISSVSRRNNDSRKAWSFGKRVGTTVYRLFMGRDADDPQTKMIVGVIIGVLALLAVLAIIFIVLYVAAIALTVGLILSPLIFGALYYFKGKDPKWFWWIGGSSLILCLDFYIFGFNRTLFGGSSPLLLKLIYTGTLATAGYFLLEPYLSHLYPYNEQGDFFDHEQNRRKSLIGGLALLCLILFLSTSWTRLFPQSNHGNFSSSTSKSLNDSESRPSSNIGAGSQETNYDKMTAIVDELRVRLAPFSNAEVIAGLKEGENVFFLGEKSDFTFTTTLRGREVTDYWYKIRTSNGKEGWVFGGGIQVSPQTSNQSATNNQLIGQWTGKLGEKILTLSIDQIQGNQVFGKNQVDDNIRNVLGVLEKKSTESFTIELKEPGDHKWDGVFYLLFRKKNGIWKASGSWKSNNGRLNREVSLSK